MVAAARTITLSSSYREVASSGRIEITTTARRPVSQYRRAAWVTRVLPGAAYPSCACSEAGAREIVRTAQRTMRFMDVTGLHASEARLPTLRLRRWPVAFDHTGVWHLDRLYLVTTEPYHGVEDVLDWCARAGWSCAERPEWGMWNPPWTRLVLCSPPHRGADLGAILEALDHADAVAAGVARRAS
jgi:hypothetical protein